MDCCVVEFDFGSETVDFGVFFEFLDKLSEVMFVVDIGDELG